MAKRRLKKQMKSMLDIIKGIFPHAKKAFPFVGSLLFGVAGFFLGAKWKAKQCEKRYARVCEIVIQLDARVRQLEAERVPQREIRKAKKELDAAMSQKIELEKQLETLRRAS